MTDTKVFNLYTLLIICGVPLIINPFSSDLYSHPKILFVYVISGILAIFHFIKYRNRGIQGQLGEYALVTYILLAGISTVLSVDPYQSVLGAPKREEGFAAICCYIFIYFICSRYYKFSKEHLKYLVVSSFIISIYGICQYYGFEPLRKVLGHTEAIATIGHRNFMGSYITLIMPISIFAFVYSKKYIYLLLSCLLYLCMLCGYTRSAWLAFVFYVCLLFYFFYKYKMSLKRFVTIIIIFFVITIGFNSINNNATLNRMLTIKSDGWSILTNSRDKESAGSHRFFIWERGVQLLKDRPLIGSGPDTFGIVFMEKFTEDVVTPGSGFIHIKKDEKGNVKSINVEKIDKAHNEYLHTAVTMGIPSLICYLIFIGGIILKAKNNIKNNIFIIPIFCSILGYLLQAFFNISVVGVAPVYWAILGITINFLKNNSSLQEIS
ncbi:O-antigen ligase family protein [Clostridium magnum]|uniref:O-antigen ligase n=1 Tax=Clostridium magnum DSM 2767 TaxID=1121326 RepID=A0A162U3Q4_9CLOT|nr:O-antigen ligase family protein [Clostridium magnum]KZL93395.1 O-antigen ligase [Clostridium magnum DSM 2767]SHI15903.1 O-Antigen ligase [Clostridium magnum DSM 2767]